jgi:hypothetical protein
MQSYVDAYNYVVEGFRRMGRKFMWVPPREYRYLATGEVKEQKVDRWGLLR